MAIGSITAIETRTAMAERQNGLRRSKRLKAAPKATMTTASAIALSLPLKASAFRQPTGLA